MNKRLCYLMSGPAHMPYLVVSLATLRLWYTDKIVVYAWPESYSIAQKIANDERLEIEVQIREPAYRGKNSQFIDKIALMQSLKDEVDVGMYLDADTIVYEKIDSLFEMVGEKSFAATQFNDWTTIGGMVSKRLGWLKEFEAIEQEHIQEVINNQYPSVNGGVFACKPDTPVLSLWHTWTMEAKSVFIADEIVLHVMLSKFRDEITVLKGGSFNCSPKYQPNDLADEDVIIRHFHGDSNVRPQKSMKGYEEWWPYYKACLNRNIGNINDWRGDHGNKRIYELEEESET